MQTSNRTFRFVLLAFLCFGVFALLILPFVARQSSANQQIIALAPSDKVTITCETALRGEVSGQQSALACDLPATPVATAGPSGPEFQLEGLQDGQIVTGSMTIQALVSGEVQDVVFTLSGPVNMIHKERSKPYAFPGDQDGVLIPWDTTQLANGDYTMTVTVTDPAGLSNVATLHFQIANGANPQPTSEAGGGVGEQPPTATLQVEPTAMPATAVPTTVPVPTGSANGIFLSSSEIASIKTQVSAGREPWASAYRKLISDANAALSAGPFTVTASGGNDYFTELPYCGWKKVDGKDPDCRDGKINPNADRDDYQQAISVGKAVRDLGLAYAFTGETRYADKGRDLIRVWALDSKTRMTPKLPSQQTIEIFITMPGLFYGADLLSSSPAWPADEQAAFKQWALALAKTAQSGKSSNNFENWRIVLMASAGVYGGNQALVDDAFGRFRAIIPEQMNSTCQMVKETNRADSLTYSLYAINAMIQGAEIARHQGVDLYNYTVDGKGLRCALDYHAPFAANRAGWPFKQSKDLSATDNVALFELAYSQWQEAAYLKVIQRYGRPMYEARTLGPVSLTHANRFELK